MSRRTRFMSALALTGALALAGCANSDPLGGSGSGESGQSGSGQSAAGDATPTDADSEVIVVGSQDYYSNEIIAEVYAQSLENAGYTVDRQFRIGQREVYLPEIEDGKIDLFPEYSGNLLQYWDPETEARLPQDVYTALVEATPEGLQVLDQAEASDQDSYTVTRAFADQWNLEGIGDLAEVTEPMVLGGNSELEDRPYGPKGLKELYAVTVGFTPVEDSGGPLTLKALSDGDIQLANIYTADPAIAANDLIVLTDTKGLFLASHVVPVASIGLDSGAAEVINKVNAAMSPADLVAMNARSVDEQLPASTIASDWLQEKNL